MMLVDCVIGTPSFIQVNVSGGEPSEVQDNVSGIPKATFTVGVVELMIRGAATVHILITK